MDRKTLIGEIKKKKSFLCIGLDTDETLMPPAIAHFPDAIFEFNKRIIDATHHLCVSYKLNTAFYEAMGTRGWHAMERTANYIPSTHFKIADAKRGDIGNTSSKYAKAFFEMMNFDAITVAPYMGEDSIRPFLDYDDKWTIVLALTSNKGAADFELQPSGNQFLFEKVIETSKQWGNADNMMYVVGATRAEQLQQVRKLIPEHFLLVPGVGAQGGSLKEVALHGMNAECGLLVNSSRNIIYASSEKDFAEAASEASKAIQQEMEILLKAKGLS